MNRLIYLVLTTLLLFTSISKSYSQNNNSTQKSRGNIFDNFAFPDAQQQIQPLSKLQNKYKLVYIWASWCPSAYIQNANYTILYNKYKNMQFQDANGFEIYSITIDDNYNEWINGKKDIGWKYDVWEKDGIFSSLLQNAGVQYVPYNILLNANNQEIARNLSIGELDQLLSKKVISPYYNQNTANIAVFSTPSNNNNDPLTFTAPFENYNEFAYTVVLGYFGNPNLINLNPFKQYGRLNAKLLPDGTTCVAIGTYPNIIQASLVLETAINNGFYDAFVVDNTTTINKAINNSSKNNTTQQTNTNHNTLSLPAMVPAFSVYPKYENYAIPNSNNELQNTPFNPKYYNLREVPKTPAPEHKSQNSPIKQENISQNPAKPVQKPAPNNSPNALFSLPINNKNYNINAQSYKPFSNYGGILFINSEIEQKTKSKQIDVQSFSFKKKSKKQIRKDKKLEQKKDKN